MLGDLCPRGAKLSERFEQVAEHHRAAAKKHRGGHDQDGLEHDLANRQGLE